MCWNVDGALQRPKGITTHSKAPNCLLKAVFTISSSWIRIWWNTQGRTKEPTKRGRGAGSHKVPGHQGPETTESRRQRGRKARGRKGGKRKAKERQQTNTRQPQPGAGSANRETNENSPGKGEAHQNASRRLTRPTRPRRASTGTHARDPGVASSDPKEEVSASTPKNPGAPADQVVERLTASEPGRTSDRVHTHQTTAGNAA